MLKNIALFVALLIPSVAAAGVRPIQNSGSVAASTATVILDYNGNATVPYGVVAATGNFSTKLGIGGVGAAFPATKLHMSSGTLTIDGDTPGFTIGKLLKANTYAPVVISSQSNTTANGTVLNYALELNNDSGAGAATGILFGVANDATGYRKGGLIFHRTLSNGVGDFAFLQNSTADGSVAGLGYEVVTIKSNGQLVPYNRTKSQIDAMTATLGGIVVCSDCAVPYSICVGTGAVISGFRRADSTTAGCGTNN